MVDGLHSVTHGKLINNFLRSLLKVDFPCIIPFGIGDLHYTVVLDIRHIVEEVLPRGKQKRVRARKRRDVQKSEMTKRENKVCRFKRVI